MNLVPTIHYYAFRLSFIEVPTMYIIIRATTKKEAVAKLPKGYQTGGYCLECRSYDDEEGAKWQISQWKEEYHSRQGNA